MLVCHYPILSDVRMALNGRQIPGYYFDAEKKKYFKISPNHSGSTYTRENVAKADQKITEDRKRDVHERKLHSERVRRSKLLQSSWCGLSLEREHNRRPTRCLDIETQIFGHGMGPGQLEQETLSGTTACVRLARRDVYIYGR